MRRAGNDQEALQIHLCFRHSVCIRCLQQDLEAHLFAVSNIYLSHLTGETKSNEDLHRHGHCRTSCSKEVSRQTGSVCHLPPQLQPT
ncbi:unnamed protein product [Knipowitschia caucasica]